MKIREVRLSTQTSFQEGSLRVKTLKEKNHTKRRKAQHNSILHSIFLLLIRYLLIPILFRLFESYFL
jgi:hypothetical protein